MAMTSVVISPATFAAATISGGCRNSLHRRKVHVVHIGGLNSFGGLKAHTSIAPLGVPMCSTQSFAMVLSTLKKSSSKGKGSGGGALFSTCNASAEIFRIATVMNVLVLIGVAVGFVLLRVEASLEEAE